MLLPGLGADRRLYARQLEAFPSVVVPAPTWRIAMLVPMGNSTSAFFGTVTSFGSALSIRTILARSSMASV